MRKNKSRKPFRIFFSKNEWQNEKKLNDELPPEAKEAMQKTKIMMLVFFPLGMIFGSLLDFPSSLAASCIVSAASFLALRFFTKGNKNVCLVPFVWTIAGLILGRILFFGMIRNLLENAANG